MKEYKLPGNRVLKIENDYNAESPRDMGNYLGTMVCLHPRYIFHFADYVGRGIGALLNDIKRNHKPLAILPLYLLDHSGLSMRTSDFGDLLDSDCVGFIYITRKDKEKLWGKTRLTKKQMLDILESEVKEYDAYLRGHTYGFTIEKIEVCDLGYEHRTCEDSCWGFFGEDHTKNGLLDQLYEEDQKAVLVAMGKAAA